MKIKDGFVLRQIAGQDVVVPVGENVDLNMMITINETGSLLWKKLEQDTDVEVLAEILVKEYDIDRGTAFDHVTKFIKKLEENGFLE